MDSNYICLSEKYISPPPPPPPPMRIVPRIGQRILPMISTLYEVLLAEGGKRHLLQTLCFTEFLIDTDIK